MGSKDDFHQLIERLVDSDAPLAEGELKKYRRNIEHTFVIARRRLRTAGLIVLVGIPGTIVGQVLAVEASRVGTTMPGWLGLVGMVLAFGGMFLVPIAALWLILFYVPRYFRARWDLRDSMLAMLVSRVDELAQRLDEITERR